MTKYVVQWGKSRKTCRRENQLEQDTRQCAIVQLRMGQEPGVGQEQERQPFYDALTREGGEPVRMGEVDVPGRDTQL